MKIFISGVMQGSMKEHGIQGQGYRQVISEAVKTRYPNAEIYDPFSAFPDSVEYDAQRAKEVLFSVADEAASADLLVAYLPEASMGSALEMIRAYDKGKTVISISPMETNWFIRAVSAKIFPSLDDFIAWIQQTHLTELLTVSSQ